LKVIMQEWGYHAGMGERIPLIIMFRIFIYHFDF